MNRLVLLGGGHAQVKVLTRLAESPLPGWEVALISPYRRQIYSGMLPGWIAGHYAQEAIALPLDALAQRAGVGLRQTTGTGLDLARGEVLCADGSREAFDLLSIDTGPEPALAGLPGAAAFALPVRPIERFIAAWPALLERMRAHRGTFDLVVLGAGAAGVEIAFALQHRCAAAGTPQVRVALVGPTALPLDGAPRGAQRRIARLLRARGIAWLGSRLATRVTPGTLAFAAGPALPFDACVVATGAAAPRWPAASGLATDDHGFIRVARTLRSVSHPQVFAAGDVAAYADARPKSGVFAVRAGPVLADNLRAASAGAPLRQWIPQRRALYLVSTGRRHALAIWGEWSFGGRWVWRWKDWIDRRFVQRFSA
jgi:pyridine nucleotide-disulfide oxidoreductase family protein